jgi:hypothetical protein
LLTAAAIGWRRRGQSDSRGHQNLTALSFNPSLPRHQQIGYSQLLYDS